MLRLSLIFSAILILGTTPISAQDASLVTRGQTLSVQHKCAMCHIVGGKGGKLSKNLDGVSARLDAAALTRILTDPEAAFPQSRIKMPRVSWKPGDIDAVVAYLQTLKDSPAK